LKKQVLVADNQGY